MKDTHAMTESDHLCGLTESPDDNLKGNPYAELAEVVADRLEKERAKVSPKKSEVAFLLGSLQIDAALAAAWETRQLRLALAAEQKDTVPTEQEQADTLADRLEEFTKPQSDAKTPAKDLNPGDIVLVPMVVQKREDHDPTVHFKPIEPRLHLNGGTGWCWRDLASQVLFQRMMKGPEQ